MANNIKIALTATLNAGNSIGEINTAIKGIEKRVNALKLNIQVDDKVTHALNNFTKQMQAQAGNKGKVKIVDDGDVKKSKEVFTTVDHAVDKFKQLGQVKISKIFDPLTNELKAFNLEIQRTDGLIDKLKFKQASATGMHGVNGFVLTGQTQNDKRALETQKALSTMLQNRAKEERKLAEEQAKAVNKNIEQKQKEIEKQKQVSEEIKHQISLLQQKMQIEATNLTRRYGDAVNKNALNNQLSQVMNPPTNFNSLKEYNRWQQQVSLGFRDIASNARTSSSHVLTLGEAFKTAMTRFPVWMAASTAFFQTLNFLKDGINFVNELNKSLTEISIVTGKSQQGVAALGREYNQLAQEMGVLTSEIASATVEFYRQGLSQEEVMEKARIATQYAKISALDFSTSAKILTAAVNSMGIDAERASDVFSYLGDATATGADEIGRAFQKVGGSAGALNVEFEKVASWIAVVSSRTRESAETIGQSMKSILARIQNMKERGFDEEDGTQVNQVAKALNEVGIALMDNTGQFRDFGKVMDELGERWDQLDSRQKAYISTTVAGTYQQSRFLNLMEGYSDSVTLYEKSLNSAGTTTEKFGLYMQGNEAALNRLKATWEGLWMSTFNSEAIKLVINSLTSIASVIKSLVDNFGSLPAVFGIAGVAILAFNGGLKSIMINGALTIATLKGIPTALTRVDSALAAATLKARMFSAASTAMTATVNGVRTALVSTGTFLAGAIFPLAGFMALGFAIGKVTEALAKQKQEEEEVKRKQEAIISTYQKRKEEINAMAKEYAQLERVRKSAEGLGTEDESRYVELQNELAKVLPTVVTGVDAKGNKILESSEAVREQIALLEEQIALQKEQLKLDAPKKIESNSSKVEELKEEKKYHLDVAEAHKKDLANSEKYKLSQAEIVSIRAKENAERLKATIIEGQLGALQQKNASAIKAVLETLELDTSITDQMATMLSVIDFAGKDIGEIEGIIASITNAINTLNEAMQSGDPQAIKDAEDSLNSLFKAYGNGKLTVKDFSDALTENTKVQQENAESKAENGQSQEDLNKVYKDAISNIEELNGVLNNLNEGEGLSADSIGVLMEKYPELLQYIDNEKVLRERVAEAIDAEKNIAIDALNQKLMSSNSYFTEIVKANQSYFDSLAGYYNVDLKNIQTLAQLKYQVETSLISKLGSAWAAYYNASSMSFTAAGKAMLSTMSYAEAVASPQLAAIAQYEAQMKSLSATMRSFTASSSFSAGIPTAGFKPASTSKSGSGSKSKSETKSWYEQYIDQLDTRIAESEARAAALDRTSKAYQNEINTQWALQTEKAKAYSGEISRLTASQGANSEEVLKLRETYASLQKEIADLNWEYYSAEIERYASKINDLNSELETSKLVMELNSDSAAKQRNESIKQIELTEKMIKALDDEKAVMQRAINNGYLNAAQKAEMEQQLKDLNKQYLEYQLNLKGANEALKELIETEKEKIGNTADDLIDIYKDFYEKKRRMDQKALDDEYSAYEKMVNDKIALIDKTESEEDYNKEVAKRQAEIAQLQAQINAMSGDSSQAGKVAGMREELAQKQLELGEFVHDREVSNRKTALQEELDAKREQIDAEKELLDRYYENLLNDEREFARMREDLMAGNIANLQNQLGEFTDYLKLHMADLGESITQNLIDKIAEATKSLKDAKDIARDISPTYSMTTAERLLSMTQKQLLDTSKPDEVEFLEDTPLLKYTENGYEYGNKMFKKGEKVRGYGIDYKDGVIVIGGGFVTADPKKARYRFFDTGGYTGNDEGLAYLHDKEIVLNKMDTSNFLKAVDITRSIAQMLPKLQLPKLSQNFMQQSPIVNLNVNIANVQGGEQGAMDVIKVLNNKLRGKGGIIFNV
jgi:TP901 family phage tail tape measure protein